MVGFAHKPTCVWEEPVRAKRRLCMRPVGCGGAWCDRTVHECSIDVLQARPDESQEPNPFTLWMVGYTVFGLQG